MRSTERQIRDEEAARLEQQARDADQRAAQHKQRAEQEAKAGRLRHSVMWETKGHRDAQQADQLRNEARDIRSGRKSLW